jgi:hypothetical protein
LLANIYLHYVLDLWVEWWRRTQTDRSVIMVRYADDFIIDFQDHADGERLLEDLRERLRKFGLELHGEKTRLIEFGRFAATRRESHQYYGVPFNSGALASFRRQVVRLWFRTLRRRSQKTRLTWERMQRLQRWLPQPRIVHHHPRERLCVST